MKENFFLRSWYCNCWLVKKFSIFMELKNSVLCPQEPTYGYLPCTYTQLDCKGHFCVETELLKLFNTD
jgi:hypothetical protein